jgi:hypothetical protein
MMTMYAQLLGSALDRREQLDVESTAGDALAELLRCRSDIHSEPHLKRRSGQALSGVAEQLAYDVALVGLARRLGIDCDLDHFDQPHRARHTLERALATRGVPLDDLNERT